MPDRPLPRDGELLILSKLEHLAQDIQALAPLLERIIAHLAAQKTPPPPAVASYAQLYPTLQAPLAPAEEAEDASAVESPTPQRLISHRETPEMGIHISCMVIGKLPIGTHTVMISLKMQMRSFKQARIAGLARPRQATHEQQLQTIRCILNHWGRDIPPGRRIKAWRRHLDTETASLMPGNHTAQERIATALRFPRNAVRRMSFRKLVIHKLSML